MREVLKAHSGNQGWFVLTIILTFAVASTAVAIKINKPLRLIDAIIWQPSLDYPVPSGNWHLLGARILFVQWLIADDRIWLDASDNAVGLAFEQGPTGWLEMLTQPWARAVIWGLAGRYDLEDARQKSEILAHQSRYLVDLVPRTPLAWYAPLEISPDLTDIRALHAYIDDLPQPLMVSAYGGRDMTPAEFAAWVDQVLPAGVTILVQDEVGVGRQSAETARKRVEELALLRGEDDVIIILEAFNQVGSYGDPALYFKPASLWQIHHQLKTYQGLSVYLFSARYLSPWRVIALKLMAVVSQINGGAS